MKQQTDCSTRASLAPSSSLWPVHGCVLSPWWAHASVPAAVTWGRRRGGAAAPAAGSLCRLSGRPRKPPSSRTWRWACPAPLWGSWTACRGRPRRPTAAWSWVDKQRSHTVSNSFLQDCSKTLWGLQSLLNIPRSTGTGACWRRAGARVKLAAHMRVTTLCYAGAATTKEHQGDRHSNARPERWWRASGQADCRRCQEVNDLCGS